MTSKTAKFTYEPGSGDADVTEAFGHVFEAGEAVTIEDERVAEKLRGNPAFTEGGAKTKPNEDPVRKESDKKLSAAIDKRTKAARTAREKADETQADAAAAERAREQAQALADARAEAEANGTTRL